MRWRKDDPACESCTAFVRTDLNSTGLRPSIETTVHALMPQRVVVHVHCVNTIAWAIRADAEPASRRSSRLHLGLHPLCPPRPAARRRHPARMRPGVDVLVLGNHGLAVAAETVEAAEALLAQSSPPSPAPSAPQPRPDRAALEALCTGKPYKPAEMDETHALATDPLALKRGEHAVFYPDHVVFLGVGVATSFDGNPPLVAIPGQGVLIHQDAKPAIEPMGRCLADVMRRVEEQDPLVALTRDDIDRLVNWDAEKYRQTLKVN